MLFSKYTFSVYFISINRSNTRHLHFYLVEQIFVFILEFSYILCNWVLKLTYIGSYWVGGWISKTCYFSGKEICASLFVQCRSMIMTFNEYFTHGHIQFCIIPGAGIKYLPDICILITVSEQLIEETSFSGVILPSPEWNTLDHIGKNARITYRWVQNKM